MVVNYQGATNSKIIAAEKQKEAGEITNECMNSSNGHSNNDAPNSVVEEVLTLREQSMLLVFLDHCFTSLEVDLVRDLIQRLVSLSMWISMMESRRDHELNKCHQWKKFWRSKQNRSVMKLLLKWMKGVTEFELLLLIF